MQHIAKAPHRIEVTNIKMLVEPLVESLEIEVYGIGVMTSSEAGMAILIALQDEYLDSVLEFTYNGKTYKYPETK
tara:strand:- start:2164 stop:2388 length:225 start_codon:yes stop_codon:yes gene_type:complete